MARVFAQQSESELKKSEIVNELQALYADIEAAKAEKAKYTDLKGQISEAGDALYSLNSQIADRRAELVGLSKAKNSLESTSRDELRKTSEELAKLIDESIDVTSAICDLHLKEGKLKSDIQTHLSEINLLKEEVLRHEGIRDGVVLTIREYQNSLDSLENGIANLVEQRMDAQAEYTNAREQLAALYTDIANQKKVLQGISNEVDKATVIFDAAQARNSGLDKEIEQKKAEFQKEMDEKNKELMEKSGDVSIREGLLIKKTNDLKAAKEYLEQFYNKKLDKIII